MMRKTAYFTALFLAMSLLVSAKVEKGSDQEMDINTSEPITYVVGIVKRGENWSQDSLRATELQEKHLAYLQTLIANDKLIASGPLKSSSAARGLYVYNVKTIAAAKALTGKDEAVSSGWIAMDFHVWDSRDYSIPETSANVESSAGLKAISITFAVVIFIFVIRTFRYKPNV